MEKDKQVDSSTYEKARGYLKAALEQMIAAGHSVKEFGEFTLEKFGDTFIPYLDQFGEDIKNGSIKIKGLGESAKTTLFGRHVTLEERERMIREASYLRSERRGFIPGYEESDWIIAEREVEERLAKEAGLVERGRNALDSASAIIEQELDDIKQVVTGWLENNPAIGETLSKVGIKAAGKQTTKTPVAKTEPAKAEPAKEEPVKVEQTTTASNKEKEVPKPTVAKKVATKKTTTKKAVKKKTANTKIAKTKTAKKKTVKKAPVKKAAAKKAAAPSKKSTAKKKAVKKKAVKK